MGVQKTTTPYNSLTTIHLIDVGSEREEIRKEKLNRDVSAHKGKEVEEITKDIFAHRDCFKFPMGCRKQLP